MKKFIKIICVLILIATVSMIAFFSKANKHINTSTLELTESIISKQSKLEETFEISGYTLDNPNVILNPYGNSPLTALVMFQSEEPGVPKITVEGKDALTTVHGEGELGTDHYVPIYGLYADKENKVIIELNGEVKEIVIKTEPIETLTEPVEIYAPDRDKLTNEFYFFSPSGRGTLPSAYDVNGDIRWYLTDKLSWDISRLDNGRLLLSTERLINSPYYNTGLYEIDLLGKIYNEYSLPGGYHHDFYELESGNLIVASDDFSNYVQCTVEDIIVEIDRKTGDVIKTWDLKEILPKYDGKSQNWSDYDWFHNNSVWYDKEENVIILSGRHQDAVIAIDYDTGELQWIIGDSTNWSEAYQKYFFTPLKGQKEFEWQWSQHAAEVTPEGYIFLLDNGNNKSKIKEEYVPAEESYTRGVMYDINTENMTIEQVWQYGKERGHEFYSPYISDVDYIDKDHYIVHSGGIVYVDGKISNRPAGFDKNVELYSTTVEILNGEKIFEITLPTNMYRVEKMNMYEKGSHFELGKGERLGSLGKTPIDKKYTGNIGKVSKLDDKYHSSNIKITNEEDRLSLNATFNKNDKVELILSNNNLHTATAYDVIISNKPFTALCIDIYSTKETENTIEINKYINKEGLYGEKTIYIKINDIIYNTGLKVNFDN